MTDIPDNAFRICGFTFTSGYATASPEGREFEFLVALVPSRNSFNNRYHLSLRLYRMRVLDEVSSQYPLVGIMNGDLNTFSILCFAFPVADSPPQDFFKLLVEGLKGPLANVTNCIYSKAKAHTVVEQTNEYARLALQCPYIPHTYLRASAIPRTSKGNKPVAAGCQQVCSMAAIKEKTGGLYVPEGKCRDSHLFNKGQKAKSDKQFRTAMGGSTHYPLPMQIHMNHLRDKEEGHHLEGQR